MVRPTTLFGLMSLQTGTELISLALILNKIVGVYGILTLVTGYASSPLQLTSFIYSLLIAVGLAFLIPQIRKQSPFHNLLLAHIYAIDTLVNLAYTVVFALHWMVARASASEVDVETGTSVGLIAAFTLLRIYFVLVVCAFARVTVRKFVQENISPEDQSNESAPPNPFAIDSALGGGWKGKVGRVMIGIGRGYWLGRKEDEEWARSVKSRFGGGH